ncbi:FAD/NAD(P)-binding domain-containing protein [Daldinia vernicosa]|uniref:FAD/NAD(P)-binding domain-containing protein n=1 Tax=Daldinia vernicosa TaxID=114800 RepID=UPI0020081DBD|nr:FAD/NAD(P)-binding domain-containing protein [Daldinia vernicosa]KAI0849456.1 FAD/NAD(P)-binding domain-containing protein [Daldinia vernicosa]
MMRANILLGTLISWVSHGLSASVNTTSFSAADTIQRDIAIVGGGSSGTHAAIQFKDAGKTVVVIEKQAQLGGHVKTFTASSGVRVNYGPSNFQNNTAVVDWFSRFDIPVVQYEQPGVGAKYADFSTGKELENGTLPNPDFGAYLEVLAKFPYLEDFSHLPDPIPEDLLLPFGEFVEKYNLQSVAYTIAQFATSNGNVFEQPTLYILKVADVPYIQGIINGDVLAPATYDAQSVFQKAQQDLGSDVLLRSTVSSATRSNTGISLVVNTPNGQKLIKANKLLVTVPPKIDNLKPFDLDQRESGILSKFQSKAFYTALLNQTGLAKGFSYYNAKPAAGQTYHVPSLPLLQFIWATKDVDTFWAWYSSATELPDATVKANIIKDFQALAPGSKPQIMVFSNAGPSGVGVTADEIKNGFYKDLLSLQGYRNTWYTGSAWVSDHSAGLWNYTNYELVPKLTQ